MSKELIISARIWLLVTVLVAVTAAGSAQNGALGDPVTTISIDAAANRHPISPLIYGVNLGSKDDVSALNSTVNRQGGNNFTTYNWTNNTLNLDNDWYFESLPGFFLGLPLTTTPGERADSFIEASKDAGAQPMITIGMMGWVAKTSPNVAKLSSFSVAKYGPQQKADTQNFPDAGNGMLAAAAPVVNNDPNDAYVPSSPAFQQAWVAHLISRWGAAAHGGVHYYIMDNEPGFWHTTHRDIYPKGVTMDDYLGKFEAYASMVKKEDPSAQIVGPELWGWPDFFASGADQKYSGEHHYTGHPDKDAHGGVDFVPWFLTQMSAYQKRTGVRLLDVFSVHIYPQGGDNNDDASQKVQLLRNRSTRSLWDPNYKDESWINNNIMLIPRMKQWVAQYYPGAKTAITEYNWGANNDIGGATAQADVLGIFGREGLDLATRWTSPSRTSPAFKAMQMYRNYDGAKSTFGDTSVSDTVPNPDDVASFAAIRSKDKALTVIVINKGFEAASVSVSLAHFNAANEAQTWQLTSANSIDRLVDTPCTAGAFTAVLPAQSITLYVVPRRGK